MRCMEMLKRAGFENISVDVMYGLPGQNLADLSETLTALMAFSPTHLSCYSLILEEGTPLMKQVAAGSLELPDEATEREMHWLVDRFRQKRATAIARSQATANRAGKAGITSSIGSFRCPTWALVWVPAVFLTRRAIPIPMI